MKGNKEKVYDFIKLYSAGKENQGVSTTYIAEALSMQRTNVSSLLNTLVEEGLVEKSNGRPVRYKVVHAGESCLQDMVGANQSLKHALQLAKAAILYPEKSLNTVIVGQKGTGKNILARKMYQFSIEQKVLSVDAPYVQMNCQDYIEADDRAYSALFGADGTGGYFKEAEKGVLYLNNMHQLGSQIKRQLLNRLLAGEGKSIIIASCNEKKQLEGEDYDQEFPIQIELPTLAERPLSERFEMIQSLFSVEAARTKRTLIVKDELMRCLLLYECETNYHQLQRDVRMGCANAYVREYGTKEGIQLFISDFPHYVRKGISKYRMHKEEINQLITSGGTYLFDGLTTRVDEAVAKNLYEEVSNNLYEHLQETAKSLNDNGISSDEINLILSAEVERSFMHYQKELTRDVDNRDQLAMLVERDLMDLVENFIQKAQLKLDCTFESSTFYGLCLHMKEVITNRECVRTVEKGQMVEILSQYKKEYMLCAEFSEQIKERYQIELSMEEIVLIAMFICYQNRPMLQRGKPVVLYAFYGEQIASSIVNAICAITQTDHIHAFELTQVSDIEKTYEELKRKIESIHQGQGVIVVYDSDYLPAMLAGIEEELRIPIRQLSVPITTLGVELVRKTWIEPDINKVYREVRRSLGGVIGNSKNYIVTLCTTGKGGAEELKSYIERYGQLKDTEVIPLSVNDRGILEETFRKLMKTGVITWVVGTFDPQLFAIPFLPISKIFSTKKEQLPKLLKMEKEIAQRADYEGLFRYLEEQLTQINMDKLRKLLPELMLGIEEQISVLSQDTEIGLMIHIACCIQRLVLKENLPVNPRKKRIFAEYDKEFRNLLKLLKPIEKVFHVIFSDDEIANIIMIIYQL